jgi:hypothetical protein
MNAYSFQDISARFTSLLLPTGFNMGYGAAIADEGIDINPKGDKNTMTIGADGSAMHSLHADNSGEIIVRTLKTSALNAMLMAQYNAQKILSSAWGNNIINVRSNLAGDIHNATRVAFRRKAPYSYKKEGGIVEWTFDAGHIDSILGTY